jgi:phage-related protein
MTGASKFSDSSAIADTMLCINKNATKVKIEVVTSASDSYVKKVVGATKIDVNFKTGSYDTKGKKAGYNFYTALRLGTKDLSTAVNEMNEAIDTVGNNLNEAFFDFLSPYIEKIKSAWQTLRKIFSVGYEYVKKGFQYLLSAFDLVPEVSGWQQLDTMDLYEVS